MPWIIKNNFIIFSNEVKEVVNEYNKAQEKETKETSNEIIYEETEEEVEY